MNHSFQELAAQEQAKAGTANLHLFNEPVENLDLVSEPNPPQGGNNQPPPGMPKWGQSLAGRVGALEGRVVNIEKNMATKTDIQAIEQRLVRIEQAVTSR